MQNACYGLCRSPVMFVNIAHAALDRVFKNPAGSCVSFIKK